MIIFYLKGDDLQYYIIHTKISEPTSPLITTSSRPCSVTAAYCITTSLFGRKESAKKSIPSCLEIVVMFPFDCFNKPVGGAF